MSIFRIALLQMESFGTEQDRNLEKSLEWCRRAADQGADLALLPEMWNMGYTWRGLDAANARERVAGLAVERDGEYVQQHRELARELGMGIAVTYLEAWPDAPRNAVSVITAAGEILFTYAKVHTCDFGFLEASCTPGDRFFVEPFPLGDGESVRIGAMICYDREFPESARTLMLQGAEVVVVPNACGLESLRLEQFRIRAWENAIGVAMTNYAAPNCNGQSVAYFPDGRGVVRAGREEGIFVASFDLDELRECRTKTAWGNAFRRPRRYGLLGTEEVAEEFRRTDAFGDDFDRRSR